MRPLSRKLRAALERVLYEHRKEDRGRGDVEYDYCCLCGVGEIWPCSAIQVARKLRDLTSPQA